MPPFLSTLRLLALMVFIALVAVAVWLADLRLAIALPLVGLAWVIAAAIEFLSWRAARAPAGVFERTTEPATPAPAVVPKTAAPPPEPEAAEPVPVPALAPPPEPPVAEPLEAAAEPEPAPPTAPEEHVEVEPPQPVPEEPEPEPAQEERALQAPPAEEPPMPGDQQPRWARRMRLRAVPTPPAAPPPTAPEAAALGEAQVVSLPQRSYAPRHWNIWDLERLARLETQRHPERRDEWAFLFVHLRQFASADGELPSEFDSLVRESFAGLLERPPAR